MQDGSGAADEVSAQRRNFALGLWAGRLLGYEGEALALYAGEIMAADLEETGSEDVVARLRHDLTAAGLDIGSEDIRARMRDAEKAMLEPVRVG